MKYHRKNLDKCNLSNWIRRLPETPIIAQKPAPTPRRSSRLIAKQARFSIHGSHFLRLEAFRCFNYLKCSKRAHVWKRYYHGFSLDLIFGHVTVNIYSERTILVDSEEAILVHWKEPYWHIRKEPLAHLEEATHRPTSG
jgi:hypothetical protein